ncbi:MAG TPA: PspA/IM30 family protein [Ktedonobacterales bacterium]|nr:PspA/IM30 family protein [Ktedonobacterales bacterium]
MGVLSRFTTYVKSLFSAILDRAEDPGMTLDYSYQKQLEQLQNLRKSIADVVTSEKRLELQKAQLTAKMATYDDAARQALQGGNEELARAALQRRQDVQTQMATFDGQIEQLKAQQQKFVDMEQRLSAKVEAFRTQKEMVKTQYSAAQAQVRIQESVTGISEEMSDVNLAVERAQDKVLQMQARANAMDELMGQGTLQEIGAPSDPIERQIAAMKTKSAVDDELAALKAQMQLPAGQDQAQLPPPNAAPTETPQQ